MKFVVENKQVVCLRRASDGAWREIIAFDAKLDAVAPHVAAVLSPQEEAALERWLEERRALRARPQAMLLLEAMPEVLGWASDALATLPEPMDPELRAELARAASELSRRIESTRTESGEPSRTPRREQLSDVEALKARLKALAEPSDLEEG